jgi:hypothetical protein
MTKTPEAKAIEQAAGACGCKPQSCDCQASGGCRCDSCTCKDCRC